MSHDGSLWIHDRRYDLFWYAVTPVALFAFLYALSAALGPRGPMLAYIASASFTGIPHNMVTWYLIMPRESRGYYLKGVLFWPLVVTAVVMVPGLLWFGTAALAWSLSIIIAIAFYHIVRQHMGLINVCDARYKQVTGDDTIMAAGRALRHLIAAVAAAAIAWKGVGPPMLLGLGQVQYAFVFYPIPLVVPVLLTVAAAFFAVRVGADLARRSRRGDPFPVAHATIGGFAIANLVGSALVPNDQFFLTLALVASYHNLQYFAFCYTHHHLRAIADPAPRDLFTRLARDRRAVAWFALPWLTGVGVVVACAALPGWANGLVLNWLMVSHYFVDGNIWRRKYYPAMGRFFGQRVQAPATAEPEASPVPA